MSIPNLSTGLWINIGNLVLCKLLGVIGYYPLLSIARIGFPGSLPV